MISMSSSMSVSLTHESSAAGAACPAGTGVSSSSAFADGSSGTWHAKHVTATAPLTGPNLKKMCCQRNETAMLSTHLPLIHALAACPFDPLQNLGLQKKCTKLSETEAWTMPCHQVAWSARSFSLLQGSCVASTSFSITLSGQLQPIADECFH